MAATKIAHKGLAGASQQQANIVNTNGNGDASVSESPAETKGSFKRGGDRRSSKGAAIQQQSRSKGASWSIWKTPGGTAPDENELRTESREEKPETIQLSTAIEFKGCG